ncbi:hypothetical protein BDZ89DRAFT_234859 [Hymenopellis radicata]|nr:hypothetical protein BDZ89DRAFT_234859 [Hymenopellis radicata]
MALSRTLPELPYDVWDAIASLVPERHIKNFYFLNSAFLHVSMAARYKSLVLEQWTSLRFIRRCSAADVCHLVKRIEIRYTRSPERTLRNIIKAQAVLLEGVVQSLNHVREIEIIWPFTEGAHDLHLFPIVWRYLGPRLTSVVIRTSAAQLALIMPTSTALSNVENICLDLAPGNIDPTGLEYLFVGANISALQLRVFTDPSPIFATLPVLPNLRTLILQCSRFSKFKESLHVATFLTRHVAGLLTLKLVEVDGCEAFTDLFGTDELALPLESSNESVKIGDEPQLQHLTLHCGGLTLSSWNRFMIELFHSFTGSLKELRLISVPLSFDELERFSALFTKDGPLLSLAMCLKTVSPSAIDLLASAFPNIEELHISYRSVLWIEKPRSDVQGDEYHPSVEQTGAVNILIGLEVFGVLAYTSIMPMFPTSTSSNPAKIH